MKKIIASLLAGFIMGSVGTGAVTFSEHVLEAKNKQIKLYQQRLEKREKLLRALFGKELGEQKSVEVTMTWYSLRPEETNSDPLTAAHGPSQPMMAAVTPIVVKTLGLKPGDRIAVISEDGTVGAIVVYWDKMNRRYDNEYRIDIVAPRWEVAKLWGVKKGMVVKL